MNNQQKTIRQRSTPYPSVPLESAIEMVANLESQFGKGPYSRDTIAEALGHSSLTGSAARKVAALSHYGLVDRNGGVYTLSSLVNNILHYVHKHEKVTALIAAVKSPILFNRLILQFDGGDLPKRLDGILIREGVSSKASVEAANIFKKSLEYVGVLQNGILNTQINVDNTTTPTVKDVSKSDISDEISTETKGQIPFPEGDNKHTFVSSGDGWTISITSNTPITSKAKRMLIDVEDILTEEVSVENN